jgi:hypothetical protein
VADEIGPSLRFATADVHRIERRKGAETSGSDDEEVAPT